MYVERETGHEASMLLVLIVAGAGGSGLEAVTAWFVDSILIWQLPDHDRSLAVFLAAQFLEWLREPFSEAQLRDCLSFLFKFFLL